MKSISLDFTNKMVCIMSSGQQGTEYNPDINKSDYAGFIPDKYKDYNSFTWNFENDTFAVNQEQVLVTGSIMTSDSFVPSLIIPMNGLKKRYKEFIDIMGYEEFCLKDEIPQNLKKILGLD